MATLKYINIIKMGAINQVPIFLYESNPFCFLVNCADSIISSVTNLSCAKIIKQKRFDFG